jgi:phospholipid/cholesterol/gamma-HCH transport system substrate-binding protein
VGVLAAGCSFPGRVEGPVEVLAVFEDVADLVVGHAVQVADVRVGSVTRIELTDDYRARVTMRIKDGLDLPADLVAVLRQTSLLGEKFIELRPREDTPEDQTACGGIDRPTGALASGDLVACTIRAPELEVIAESAVRLLDVVAANQVTDLSTIIRTGAEAFGGRGEELRGIIDSLGTISGTLSDQTQNLLTIIDGIDSATQTLADGAPELDQLLVNLADTTQLLADDRDQAVATLEALTRLARDQNQLIFQPYLDQTTLQIHQLDQILQVVADGRGEVGQLLDWLDDFVAGGPLAIPCRPPVDATQPCQGGDFAQVYGWFVPAADAAQVAG